MVTLGLLHVKVVVRGDNNNAVQPFLIICVTVTFVLSAVFMHIFISKYQRSY